MMAEDYIFSSRPLSLFNAAFLALANKARHDGIVELIKALARLCKDERPLVAIARHCNIVEFFNQPSMAALKPRLFADRYLGRYLTKSLRKPERRDILLHHYRCIANRAAPDFLQRAIANPYVLWSKKDDKGCYSMTLTLNTSGDYEGDLLLSFMNGAQPIFGIAFSIVPGSAIGSDAAELLFVGRVQGAKHRFDEIKQATKACRDVAPQHMLMIAVQSIAQALRIDTVAGVTDEDQLADEDFRFGYDAFWENWHGRRTAHFYEIPIPLPQTALSDIQTGHRRRTRKKREFKGKVANEIACKLGVAFPGHRETAA